MTPVRSTGCRAAWPGHHGSMIARRGSVLLAVLVITGSALLVATGLIAMTTADAASATNQRRDAASRALVRSGLQIVMQRLDEQRETILSGATPELDAEYRIYETPARLGVVRLLPIHGDELLVAEAGKLDLNHVDAEALAATGLVREELADRIIAFRDELGRPFQSVGELLAVDGVTPELLYGPLAEFTVMRDGSAADADTRERMALRLDVQPVDGIADVATVFAVEPSLQSTGARRIRLDIDWSEELARRCRQRFGPLAAHAEALFQSDSIETDADIVRALRGRGAAVQDWPVLLDAFTAEPGVQRFGRLDINTAPYEALLALPGIEPVQAEAIIRRRDRLSESERSSIAWPVVQQIIDEETLQSIAGQITTRSFTYRVRLAAGEVTAEMPDGPLDNALIYEAVIDLADRSPRLAHVRDITLLETAAQLAAAGVLDAPESDEADKDRDRDDAGMSYEEPLESPASPDATVADEELGPSAEAAPATEDAATASSTREAAPSGASRIGRWKSGNS